MAFQIRSLLNIKKSNFRYHLYSTHPSLFLNNDPLSQTTKVIPELKEFLEGLDITYGNGKYTQYLEIFEKHDIRVSLIPKISDEW